MLQSIDNIYYTAINFIPFWNNSTYNSMMNVDGGLEAEVVVAVMETMFVVNVYAVLCYVMLVDVACDGQRSEATGACNGKLLFTIRLISFITSHL